MESGSSQPGSSPKTVATPLHGSSTPSGLVQLLTSPTKSTSSLGMMGQLSDAKSTIHYVGVGGEEAGKSNNHVLATAASFSHNVTGSHQFFTVEEFAPRVKRRKFEEIPPNNDDVAEMRKSITNHYQKYLHGKRERYSEFLSELYFLQNGFNAMDYISWKKRTSPHVISYLKLNCLDSDEDDEHWSTNVQTCSVTTIAAITTTTTTTTTTFPSSPVVFTPSHTEVKFPAAGGTPVAVSTILPPAVSQLSQQGGTPLVLTTTSHSSVVRPSLTMSVSARPADLSVTTTSVKSPATVTPAIASSSSVTPSKLNRSSTLPTQGSISQTVNSVASSPSRLQTRLHSISAVYDSTIGSQEEIAERAKQEAYVMQRVSELRKEGVWSEKRLPKVQEPVRAKAHWDYLLEEMAWLSVDFAQERKWKKTAAKKCARMCQKFHLENKLKEERAEKEIELKLKRMASTVAKEIKQFWTNVEKFVEYKQQSRLDMKRKKVLDLQLNFIVDQTEKYSTWVAEGMNKSVTESSQNISQLSRASSPSEVQTESGSDGDFEPSEETSDDEETIAKAEKDENQNEDERKAEIDLLEKESLVPLEELLESLPPEFLKGEEEPKPGMSKEETTDSKGDSDFEMKSEDESGDDESTMEAEEAVEGEVDYVSEINQLKDEGNMSIEELIDMYKGAYDKVDSDDDSSSEEEDGEESEGQSSDEESKSMSEEDSELDIGLESLINVTSEDNESSSTKMNTDGPSREITDIAAAAESFKPKGYTYSTVQVAVKVPHLLRHSLREYQHIGLDWLVTMYERKLNGILADEMGLGKTIQTISLLAYLACEKGNWGPHLIVVPTSVMLNWEMEFKKWCPGFKILTYYGNPKERKLKRQGWTKPNTFHVCITSYKLVIQDHQSFRRKKWKYFILDEAQNIKNFKSQRWQLLLNFKSHRRLLLTGTPLQNSLMELWSLMHFLMPNVFLSHQDFKEWFANPVSGMIEGSHEYNKELINRLHKVLRPFLLRRLKSEVEKQLPSKYEHVVMCRLSKRQRYLYDDFMSQTKTKETLASGNFMSVINVLMQLRKVCNHPNLFESRPIVSPFQMEGILFHTASLISKALEHDPFKVVNLATLNLLLVNLELSLTAFAAHRIKRFQTPRKLIEEIDDARDPPPKCPAGKIKLHVRTTSSGVLTPPGTPRSSVTAVTTPGTPLARVFSAAGAGTSPRTPSVDQPFRFPLSQPTLLTAVTPTALTTTSSITTTNTVTTASAATVSVSTPTTTTNRPVSASYTLQLVQPQSHPSGTLTTGQITPSSTPITVHIHQTQQGARLTVPPGQLAQLPTGYAQLVQTATGQHILLTSSSSAAAVLQTNSTVQSIGGNQRLVTPTRVTAPHTTITLQTRSSPVITPASNSNVDAKVAVTPSKPILRLNPVKSNLAVTALTSSASTVAVSSRITPDNTKPVTRQQTRASDEIKNNTSPTSTNSQFYLEDLVRKRQKHRKDRLERLARLNTRRCDATPVYGSDLIEAVTVINSIGGVHSSWNELVESNSSRRSICERWDRVTLLDDFKMTPESCLKVLEDTVTRFSFVVPSVMAPEISYHISHPSPWRLHKDLMFKTQLRSSFSTCSAFLHPLISSMSSQFPDARLIQYDCGKLQTLDKLLRNLKCEGRRALIFTQMARMLDILEQFLNYHGHIYLRLDGATKVDQRQALMERFNADRRIFCFILSTRSGGIGVNLTGADTVIFYDSDWNPTMDAQAQDRCHRIGQTRDVHIYRLISDRTVEENILKKANQKRLLGEVAIEGGNFTTAFFKKHTLQELFEVNFDGSKAPEKPVVVKPEVAESTSSFEDISNVQLEHALANAEEELDIQAAKSAKKEADLELVEFDETVPYDGDSARDEETVKMEEELGAMIAELTPIQRYAMNFLESSQEPFCLEQLKQAEEEIEAQKKDWELGRLQALRAEEERRAQMDDSELLCTYQRDDASNQIFISSNTGETMPIWAPPTPPQEDGDVYIDYSMCFLYEPTVMPESQLPPVYVRKEHKRMRLDNNSLALVKKQKSKKDDALVNIPRSLFDRPSAAVLKMRKDAKLQRIRGFPVNPTLATCKPPIIIHKPMVDAQQDSPEWLIHEDWALLQAVQTLLELPLNLVILSPGHIPNWDFVADVVNSTSRCFRAPKQCRIRYETVIIPREEGKILYDINPNKPKKSKGIYRTKNNRPMKTSQLFLQDNNASFTQLYHQRFETMKVVSNKRMPSLKQVAMNSGVRNVKHITVLAEHGINYDSPPNPVQVAAMRAERIQKEKLKTQVLAQSGEQQQVVAAQQLQQQNTPSPATAPTAGPVSGLQLARPQIAAPTGQQVLSLNQQQMATTNQAVIAAHNLQNVMGRVAVTTTGLTPITGTAAVRPQRTAPTVGNQLRSVVPQTIVSMTNASGAQTIQQVVSAAQRVTPTAVVTNIAPGALSAQVVSSPGKSPTQLQLYARTPTHFKQQRLQGTQQHQVTAIAVQQAQQSQQQKVPVSVTSLLSPNVATVQLTQAQQQHLRSQTVSPAEMTQLLKRQQLQLQQAQQQKAAAAVTQVTQVQVPAQNQQTVQQLSPAQLQQLQQQQAAAAAAIASGQGSFATLVKTVTTPAGLGAGTAASPTVTIPVGMNINLKAAAGATKNVLVTHQQQQVEQLKFQQQQQLVQRKLLQQQKMAQLAHAKSAIGTVQLVPQATSSHKAVPTTMTVQLQQVMKQVQSQGLQQPVSAVATTTNLATGTQCLPHTFITKTGQVTIASPTTVTTALQARVVPIAQNVATAVVPSSLTQTHGNTRQTIQLRIPPSSGSTFTIDSNRTQTVNVVSTTSGFSITAPTLTVTLPGTPLQLQNKDVPTFEDRNTEGQ